MCIPVPNYLESGTPFKGPLSDADGCSSFSISIMAELLLQDNFESFGPAPSSRTSETTLNVVELPE